MLPIRRATLSVAVVKDIGRMGLYISVQLIIAIMVKNQMIYMYFVCILTIDTDFVSNRSGVGDCKKDTETARDTCIATLTLTRDELTE